MLEVLFGDSAAGGLSGAMGLHPGAQEGCAAGIGSGLTDFPPRTYEGFAPYHGVRGDILPLCLALDVGDIAPGSDPARQDALTLLYGRYDDVAQQMARRNRESLSRLEAARVCGEPVRVWVGMQDPAERLGLGFVCAFLRRSVCGIHLAQVDGLVLHGQGDAVQVVRCTGELVPEQFGVIAQSARLLAPGECSAYALEWAQLCQQNAPLRTVICGMPMSVSEDFYDFALQRNIPQGQFVLAQLLGKTLSQLPGVSDAWLYLRAMHLVTTGKLVRVTPPSPDHPYSAVYKTARA